MANGFDAKDAAGSTVKIASISTSLFGLTSAQAQANTLVDGAGANLATIDSTGAQLVDQRPSATTSVTSAAGSTSAFTVLALNANRRGATLFNDSTQITYIKLGSAASTTSYTIQLPASTGYWEVPFGYTGIITGIQGTANGSVRVTEITA